MRLGIEGKQSQMASLLLSGAFDTGIQMISKNANTYRLCAGWGYRLTLSFLLTVS
jgi:hypothetical protein